mgnify:FL=1
MKKIATLLLLSGACLAAPKSPQQIVQDFYSEIAKRGGNYQLTAEELEKSPWLKDNFKRELVAQRKGEYKQDGRWLIDFDLLTDMQTDTPTSARALPAQVTGQQAIVPLQLNYVTGVRQLKRVESLKIHLQQTSAGWQIDNVLYSRPGLIRKDALGFLKWAREGSGHK